MRILSVILVLLIAAQPVQAGFCDMRPSGDAPPASHLQHGAMQNAAMQHDGKQHAAGADSARHDCCAATNPESDPGCAGLDQCGSCTISLAAVPALSRLCALPAAGVRASPLVGQLALSHSAPPYRPPSAIS